MEKGRKDGGLKCESSEFMCENDRNRDKHTNRDIQRESQRDKQQVWSTTTRITKKAALVYTLT